jgi:signal transduction histidine kinase
MERLRIRIAGDLHDDLSSDLSGIAVVADMLRQTDGLGAAELSDLGTIRDASLHMADGLRDIVWYIDPEHDSLTATVRRMRSVASTLLRGIDHVFHSNIPERDVPLPVNTRRNVFLIFKEAIHNIVRHANATRVEIKIAVAGHRLQLHIADDGQGFDPEAVGDGHGLRSMHRRAEDISGRLEIRSAPGAGTELRLTVQMAHSRDGRGGRSSSMVVGVHTKD